MRLLVVNAGSSSLKLSVIADDDQTLLSEELEAPSAASMDGVQGFVERAGPVDAVGHRLVHGGEEFVAAVRIDDSVRRRLDAVSGLAPLHMPPALALVDRLRALLHVPQVACFDTAFHASMPAAARTYALPQRWRALGVRRYGFHGLSCAWSLRRAALLLQRDAGGLQLVVAHLGSGASVTAILEGRSADTSMGFTPLDGLVMATRSGSVDPGALTWLQREHGVDAVDLDRALEHESGLLGLSGTADMRTLLQQATDAIPAAGAAVDVYVHRAAACIAAVSASLQRLDALVFTAGVGEGSHEIRRRITASLAILGLPARLRQRDAGSDCMISEPGAAPAVLVVTAREDLQIANEVRGLLQG